MKKLNRHQQSLRQLESLERREMLTAEFIGHFDFWPNVVELGDDTILMTSSPFADEDRIWRLDDYGMKQLTPEIFDSIHDDTVAVADQLFFFPDTAEGDEVWVTDGTEDGTQRVFTPAGAARVRANNSVAFDNKLYFPQRDELWVTDGTVEGTQFVIDTDPSRQPCMEFGCNGGWLTQDIIGLTAFHDSIFFTIWKFNQTELWQSDGTAEGTRIVTSIPVPALTQLSVQDDHLLLSNGASVRWISDGTAEGTVQLPDLSKNGILVGQNVFHLENSTDDNYELWVETDSGRQLLKTDVIVRSWCSVEFQHAALGERLLFPAEDENGNPGLWTSDGTVAGTELVKDTSLIPARLIGDELLLWGRDDEAGTQLWKTDGTTDGTMRITDMNSGPESSFAINNRGWVFSNLNVAHNYLYFTTGRPAGNVLGVVPGNGMNLWRLSLTDDVNNTNNDVIDTIYAAIAAESYESRFDLVDDDKLDESDVQYLVEGVLQTQFGDTNLDGQVDFADFLQLSSNFGLAGRSWSQGDFNGDGNTGFEDFLLLSKNFGVTTTREDLGVSTNYLLHNARPTSPNNSKPYAVGSGTKAAASPALNA